MKNDAINRWVVAGIFLFIAAAGFGLHFFNIGYPATPVFDEAHFATYAGDYATGRAFVDIHPPLGKLILASVLTFYPPQTLAKAQFINVVNLGPAGFFMLPTNTPFGDFPYVALRILSALFGMALPFALYFFLRNIGVGKVGAGLAALLLVFDNAILLTTRLILLDGMFLLFGLIALGLYFHKKCPAIAAGIFWGLALAVKLTAIVFVVPVIVAYFLVRKEERKNEKKLLLRFAIFGIATLCVIAFMGTFIFTPAERIGALHTMGFLGGKDAVVPTAQQIVAHPLAAYLFASLREGLVSIAGYTFGDPHQKQSPWYFWPAAEIPMTYYSPDPGQPGGPIALAGNPLVWIGATLAVILGLAFFLRYLNDHRTGRKDRREVFILLGGYLGGLFPFLFLQRSTFLYHYFPSLLFGIGLLGYFGGKFLKAENWTDLTPKTTFLFFMILLVVVAGFLYVAPVTYGL